MPVHDWSHVNHGEFHDFHQSWSMEIRNALNASLLPSGYYAMVEQAAYGRSPDVLTLARADGASDSLFNSPNNGSPVALLDSPPAVEFVIEADVEPDAEDYAARANHVVIRHANGDEAVAFVEIVSPGNKDRRQSVEQFCQKLSEIVSAGCHVLVVDILPPGSHDPGGLHATFWSNYFDEEQGRTGVDDARPLGLTAYQALLHSETGQPCPRAYFQPLSVGSELIDMPLFLTPRHHVSLPLEATYSATWSRTPGPVQERVLDHA